MESDTEDVDDEVTFESLGIVEPLVKALDEMGFKKPTKIQQEAIPEALKGRDIIGLAQTGSGKTAAFALPILQSLLKKSNPLFACIVAPTRELSYQIGEQFEALGSSIGVKCVVIVGGMDHLTQAIGLAKKPHIIIGTPGRLVFHLENTKGFSLHKLKYLVLDEADRLLNMDFEEEINKLLRVLPKERTTYLYSATMTQKVEKLQRACLVNPVQLEVSSKYKTVDTLLQQHLFIPHKYKECYLVLILNESAGNTTIIFTATCASSGRITLMLRNLGFSALPLNGDMSQEKRLSALTKFKMGERNIMVATDVASRGLDIPSVDLVVNFDVPSTPKDYVHRVGRTARAGRSGRAVTIVTQYDVELYLKVEEFIRMKLPTFPAQEGDATALVDRVNEAQRLAGIKLRELGIGTKSGDAEISNDINDSEDNHLNYVKKRKFDTKAKFKSGKFNKKSRWGGK